MKKIYILSLVFCLLTGTGIFSQQWTVRFNGTGNGVDAVKAMVADKSGNVYITGSSYSSVNSDDYVTVKYNSSGVQQWLVRYDGPGNGSDVPAAIYVDAGGNVYVTGYSDQLTGNYINNDAATVKYSPSGTQLWVARFDGVRQRADAGTAIRADGNGNIFITGYTTVRNGAYTKKDYLTIKYSSSGVQQWIATYNGPANQDDAAVGLGLDTLGNVYVTGTSFAGADPAGEEDYATIKYNATGVQQWVARYNGPVSEPDRATGIAVDKAGNSYVTGYSQGMDLDFATVKYNANGTQQWVARYDGAAHSSDIPYAIALDNSGNVYVTGGDQTTIYNSDYCTIKYNSSGVMQWRAHYAGAAKDNDEAYALAVDGGGNVYVTGYINGVSPSWDMATVKYNSAGVQQWVKTYNGPGNGNDNGAAVGVDASGNVYVTGTSQGKTSDLDFVTIKYNSSGLITASRVQPENTGPRQLFSLYPNPATHYVMIQLPEGSTYDITITDMAGRKIWEERNLSSQVQVNCDPFAKGNYFVNAKDDKKIMTIQFTRQ